MATTNLGAKVRAARKVNGWTLRELGELTGLSIGYLSTIERGRTNPSFKNVCLLSELFEINLFPTNESPLSHEEMLVIMTMRKRDVVAVIRAIIRLEQDGYFG